LTDAELAALAEEDRGNRSTWEGTMRQEASQAGHDLRGRLGEVRAPTLVIHGDADPLVRLEHGEVLAAGIPGARLLVLPGVGHLPWVERPNDVARAILDFLAASLVKTSGTPGSGIGGR
jgi:pimeloyl-ACP methyl ester carboxylesterase